MAVFGGLAGKEAFHDLWTFDFKDKWTKVEPKSGPGARAGAAAFSCGHDLFVFGGLFDGYALSDVWKFSGLNSKWTQVKSKNPKQKGVRSDQVTDFLARFYHSILPVGDNHIFIFGGRNEDHSLALYFEVGRTKLVETKVPETAKTMKMEGFSHQTALNLLNTIYVGGNSTSRHVAVPAVVQSRMEFLMKSGLFSDIAVRTNDGQVINGHKVLFNANCHLFEALLDSVPSNGDLPVVPLDTLKSNEFLILQRFLYGVPVKITAENVANILTISNQMMVGDLEAIAIDYVLENTATVDIFDLFVLSQKLSLKKLEQYLCWYMKVNYAQLEGQGGWKRLTKEERNEIEKNRWPNAQFLKDKAAWQIAYDHEKQKKQKGEKCSIQ